MDDPVRVIIQMPLFLWVALGAMIAFDALLSLWSLGWKIRLAWERRKYRKASRLAAERERSHG